MTLPKETTLKPIDWYSRKKVRDDFNGIIAKNSW